MTGRRLLRELLFPATNAVVLIAITTFALLGLLAQQAGLLGLWLGVILLPAIFRYLLMLLEARALGRTTPVAGIELFNIADNFWSLAPLVLLAASIWGGFFLYLNVSAIGAWAVGLLLVVVLPASLAILAVTRSPWASLDPRAIARLIRACGPAYALAPAVLLAAPFLLALSRSAGLPAIVELAFGWYALFLLFTLTGALIDAGKVRISLSIPDPVEPDEAARESQRDHARRQVLTHAYGFFSRQNRAGGMAHLREALRDEAYDDAWRWYVNEMFKWESKEPALMLARDYLSRLLDQRRDFESVKLIGRCLLEDERFRPRPEDRDRVRELLGRLGRDDLAAVLES